VGYEPRENKGEEKKKRRGNGAYDVSKILLGLSQKEVEEKGRVPLRQKLHTKRKKRSPDNKRRHLLSSTPRRVPTCTRKDEGSGGNNNFGQTRFWKKQTKNGGGGIL